MIHSITNQVWSRQSQTVFTKTYKKKNHNYKYKALWIIVQDHFIKIKKSTAKSQNMVCNLMKQYHSLKNIKKSWQIMKSTPLDIWTLSFWKFWLVGWVQQAGLFARYINFLGMFWSFAYNQKLHLGKPWKINLETKIKLGIKVVWFNFI